MAIDRDYAAYIRSRYLPQELECTSTGDEPAEEAKSAVTSHVDDELMSIREYCIETRQRVLEVQAKLDAFIADSQKTLPTSPMEAYAQNLARQRAKRQETEKDADIAESQTNLRNEQCDELYGDCC